MTSPNPPTDTSIIQYILGAASAIIVSLITLIGLIFTQNKQSINSKKEIDQNGVQKDKELELAEEKQNEEIKMQKEKQDNDLEGSYYKNLVDVAEKVQKMLTDGYETRILTIEKQLKESDDHFISYQSRVNELIEKLEQDKIEGRKKISKLERRLIEGYNVIMKLLALLKQHEIIIPEELQKEIEQLKPSDTQQL